MAFNANVFKDLLMREQQDQSTEVGRLARLILQDSTWDFTAALATQQAAVVSKIGGKLGQYESRNNRRGHDPVTLQTLLGEVYARAS